MEVTCLPSGRRVCVTLGIRGNLKVWNRGRDGRFPSHANEAMEIDWMEVWTQTSVPVPYLGKHLCVGAFPSGFL